MRTEFEILQRSLKGWKLVVHNFIAAIPSDKFRYIPSVNGRNPLCVLEEGCWLVPIMITALNCTVPFIVASEEKSVTKTSIFEENYQRHHWPSPAGTSGPCSRRSPPR